jgi:uracil-DNA glycosylase
MTDGDPSKKAQRLSMTLPEADYLPRSMQDAGVRERRRAMLGLDHITELTSFAAELRKGRRVPDFDPCDGGVNAQALFFLDTPGPEAKNSEFVSSNNSDPTAMNMADAWKQAGLNRCHVLLWNVVPHYVENDTTETQVREAVPDTQAFIDKLPDLKVVVFCGRKALMAKKHLRLPPSVVALSTCHTGAMAYNHYKRDIHDTFRTASRLLELLK